MFIVVPGKEATRPGAGIRQAAKASGIVRPILHRLELRFREGIVVWSVRPRMALSHIQVDEQLGHALGNHSRAAVSVKSQLPPVNLLFSTAGGNQLLGQIGRFPLQRPTSPRRSG